MIGCILINEAPEQLFQYIHVYICIYVCIYTSHIYVTYYWLKGVNAVIRKMRNRYSDILRLNFSPLCWLHIVH